LNYVSGCRSRQPFSFSANGSLRLHTPRLLGLIGVRKAKATAGAVLN